MDRVKEKVAIVTGAGSGLGRAEAVMLAKEGAKVAVTDINDASGMETVEIIRNAGGEAEYWHLDASEEKECKAVIDAVAEKFGKIEEMLVIGQLDFIKNIVMGFVGGAKRDRVVPVFHYMSPYYNN